VPFKPRPSRPLQKTLGRRSKCLQYGKQRPPCVLRQCSGKFTELLAARSLRGCIGCTCAPMERLHYLAEGVSAALGVPRECLLCILKLHMACS